MEHRENSPKTDPNGDIKFPKSSLPVTKIRPQIIHVMIIGALWGTIFRPRREPLESSFAAWA